MNITLTDIEAKQIVAERFNVTPNDIVLLNSVPISIKHTFEAVIELNAQINRIYDEAGYDADQICLIRNLREVLRLDLRQSKDLAEMIIADSKKI